MKIVVISNTRIGTKLEPMGGFYAVEHARTLSRGGIECDLLSADFVSLGQLFGIWSRKQKFKDELHEISGWRLYLPTFFSIYPLSKIIYTTLVAVVCILMFSLKYRERRGLLIHAHEVAWSGLSAYWISKLYKIPFIISEHNSALITEKRSARWNLLFKKIYKSASLVVVPSSFLGDELRKVFDVENLISVPNIINTPIAKYLVAPLPEPPWVVGLAGSLDPNKNQALAIKALASLLKKKYDIRLLLIGDGPDRSKLMALCESLGVNDRVFFYGDLQHNECLKVMSRCHIGLSTSVVETFGVSILEFIALGKPVVCTPSGGPDDFLSKENSFVSSGLDVCSYVTNLELCIKSYAKFNIEEISKTVLGSYSPSKIVNKYRLIYSSFQK